MCAYDPGLFPEQLMRCAGARAGMGAVFHIGWLYLSSALHGWAASGPQAWLLICYDAVCSADVLLHVSDCLSHLPRCLALCG